MKIINVVGARPNFIKIAPLMAKMQQAENMDAVLLHTGQHYDYAMSENFFDELGIPKPDIHFNVGSDSHGKQVARIMQKFDDLCDKENPDMVIVVGDVNSTMACSLVASKRGIKVAHIEAGIRSWDRSMPEEVNRIVTDSITDYFFPPSADAVTNLINEGHSEDQIFLVGNIMIDTLKMQQAKIDASEILSTLNLKSQDYALLTLHRPANVDDKKNLGEIVNTLLEIQNQIKVVFPVHPRTLKQLKGFDLYEKLRNGKNILLTEPLGYHDFGSLVKNARFVLTDSGGIQEETTLYKVPCITLRENTERPITVEVGTNEIAGIDKKKILNYVDTIMRGKWKTGSVPELWDGKTAQRIVEVIQEINKARSSLNY
jgi:UDP-N-acetylglucosamine 2-epimerase (non-hydrolysing)